MQPIEQNATFQDRLPLPPAKEARQSPSVAPNHPNDITSAREVFELLKEDLETHDGDWTRPGFQAVALHRLGNWRMKITSRALRLPFSALYNGLGVVVRNVYGIELPYTVRVGRRVIIEHQGSIVVHGNAGIGDDSILRQGVTLGNRRKDRPFDAPQIGRNVNIGAGAKIIGDVIVGDGASIGANAVVTRDVRPGSVMVGIPATEVPRKSGISDTFH